MLGSGFYVAIPPWRSRCGARAPLSPVRSESNVIYVPDREYSDGEVALIDDHIDEMLVIEPFEEHIFATPNVAAQTLQSYTGQRFCVEGLRRESRLHRLLSADRQGPEQNDRLPRLSLQVRHCARLVARTICESYIAKRDWQAQVRLADIRILGFKLHSRSRD